MTYMMQALITGRPKLLTITERTDEEVAAEELGGDDLAVIPADDWRHIVRIPGLPALVLDRIEGGGLVAVNELLARHGVGPARSPEMLRYLE